LKRNVNPDITEFCSADGLRARLREMRSYTDSVCERRRMSPQMRAAADRASREVFGARRLFFFRRYPEEMRTYLELMLRLVLAQQPELAQDATGLAAYLAGNYPFEWTRSGLTATVRHEARHVLETIGAPDAAEQEAAFAYARCHARTLRHRHPTDPQSTLSLARELTAMRYFADRAADWRKDLGMG
jgi:hypothetical protein